jgi:hypothetical protein
MEHTKRQSLDAAVAGIKQRFGARVLHTLGEAESVASVSTGFAKLDKALGIGGVPRGHITELVGTPTSGLHTLVFKVIANAHRGGDMVVYLDLSHTFDPDYAVRCGVDIGNLLLVRPTTGDHALDMAYSFATQRSAGVIVYDDALLQHGKSMSFAPLLHPLASARCALLRIVRSGEQSASVRLHLSRERWLRQRRDVSGYWTRIHILKNKFAPTAEAVCVTIGFHSVVLGDGV